MSPVGDYNRFFGQVAEGGLVTQLSISNLTDTDKHWEPDQWKGKAIRLRGGANNEWMSRILTNDTKTIWFESLLNEAPESPVDSAYEILGSISLANSDLTLQEQTISLLEDIRSVLVQIRLGLIKLSDTDLTDG